MTVLDSQNKASAPPPLQLLGHDLARVCEGLPPVWEVVHGLWRAAPPPHPLVDLRPQGGTQGVSGFIPQIPAQTATGIGSLAIKCRIHPPPVLAWRAVSLEPPDHDPSPLPIRGALLEKAAKELPADSVVQKAREMNDVCHPLHLPRPHAQL